MNTQFTSIRPIDRTLSGAITLFKYGPGGDGNKEILRTFQNSSFTVASPSYCLVSSLGHSLVESNPSKEMQSVYYTTPADWATGHSLEESYPSAEMHWAMFYPSSHKDQWLLFLARGFPAMI